VVRWLTVSLAATLSLVTVSCGGSEEPVSGAIEASRPVGTDDSVSRSETMIIDVRTAEEFAAGHLDGAVNIDLQSADFADRIATLDPSGSYVVYCRSGNRSGQAQSYMKSIGFGDVENAGSVESASTSLGLPIVVGP